MMEPSDTPENPRFPSSNEEGMEQIEYNYSLGGSRLVAIDERYVVFSRGAPGIQMRIGVSYGPDETMTMARGIFGARRPRRNLCIRVPSYWD
jgi:hypothetical protein